MTTINHALYIQESIDFITNRGIKLAWIDPFITVKENRTIHVGGIRQSGKTETIKKLISKYPSIVVTAWNVIDLLTTTIPKDLVIHCNNLKKLSEIKIIPKVIFIDVCSRVFDQISQKKLYRKLIKHFGNEIIIVQIH